MRHIAIPKCVRVCALAFLCIDFRSKSTERRNCCRRQLVSCWCRSLHSLNASQHHLMPASQQHNKKTLIVRFAKHRHFYCTRCPNCSPVQTSRESFDDGNVPHAFPSFRGLLSHLWCAPERRMRAAMCAFIWKCQFSMLRGAGIILLNLQPDYFINSLRTHSCLRSLGRVRNTSELNHTL